MKKFHSAVIKTNGDAVPDASVTIYLVGTTDKATIYSDEGITPKNNPTTTDAQGRFEFYAADADYDIEISGAGIVTYKLEDITITDPKEAITEKHSHDNKATLDLIEEALTTALKTAYDLAVTNEHTHSNKATLDLIEEAFTSALKTDYDDAVAKEHEHSNKATLDLIEEALTSALKTNYDSAYDWGDHSIEGYLKNLVEDTTPQLGGDLDGQSYKLTAGDNNVLGSSIIGGVHLANKNLDTTGNIIIESYSSTVQFGTGVAKDGKIGHDGDSLNIVANAAVATDNLIFSCNKFKHKDGTFDLDDGNLTTTGKTTQGSWQVNLSENDYFKIDSTATIKVLGTEYTFPVFTGKSTYTGAGAEGIFMFDRMIFLKDVEDVAGSIIMMMSQDTDGSDNYYFGRIFYDAQDLEIRNWAGTSITLGVGAAGVDDLVITSGLADFKDSEVHIGKATGGLGEGIILNDAGTYAARFLERDWIAGVDTVDILDSTYGININVGNIIMGRNAAFRAFDGTNTVLLADGAHAINIGDGAFTVDASGSTIIDPDGLRAGAFPYPVDVFAGHETTTDAEYSVEAAMGFNIKSKASTDYVYGIFGLASATGAYDHTDFIGLMGYTSIDPDHTGTITNNIALLGYASSQVAGSTSTNVTGVKSSSYLTAGTIENFYFFLGDDVGHGATITNAYGLYLPDIDYGATLNYAIYTNAGLVRFGDKVIFTQVDGNEAIDSLNDNYMDYMATLGHRFNNTIQLPTDKKLQLRDSAIGIYSQADTFMDLFADGAVRIGDSSAGAPTNYLNISSTGVVTMVGTAKRTLNLRPDMDFAIVRANGKPTQITYGAFSGYSLPIYNNDNEELFFSQNVPGRWDGASNIVIHVLVALSEAEDVNDDFNLQVSWENSDLGEPIVNTTHDVEVETNLLAGRVAAYDTYEMEFIVDYDADDPALIEAHDLLAWRLRRVGAAGTEIAGEVIVLDFHVHFTVDKMFRAS